MNDVRVSASASFALIELLTPRAKSWYCDNVPNAPSVPSSSLTLDAGPAADLLSRMAGAGLKIEKN